jgi:hypothetical protein
MTEQRHVWEPLRKATSPPVDWMRLENLVGTGMSDANGCLNGVEVWVEHKIVKGHRIIFRPTQPAWMTRRAIHGGRVFVLARKDDFLYLWSGPGLRVLLQSCQTQGDTLVADYRAADPVLLLPKPFDWQLLLETLFGHKATENLNLRRVR